MGSRSGRRHVSASTNQAIIAAGRYTARGGGVVALADAVDAACRGTVSYTPEQTAALLASWSAAPEKRFAATLIEVTAETTMTAARRLAGTAGGRSDEPGHGRVGALNFASARNPGGGYLGGARAQEEDLCRAGALYPALLGAPDFYAAHRASSDLMYSHRVIFSPDVPVFRDEHNRLLDRLCPVSFLTSPAPNTGAAAPDRRPEAPALLTERAARVLAVAAHHGCRSLVLGAWGCGVFRNDPAHVAAAFRAQLCDAGPFSAAFAHVVFAVADRSAQQRNLRTFQAAFDTGI
jgi:uncharacterized protein (TIGR02452 family)